MLKYVRFTGIQPQLVRHLGSTPWGAGRDDSASFRRLGGSNRALAFFAERNRWYISTLSQSLFKMKHSAFFFFFCIICLKYLKP